MSWGTETMRGRVRLFTDGLKSGGTSLSLPTILLALLVALCVSRAVYGLVQPPASYDHFIVGMVTYAGTGKARDFLAVFVFVLVATAGLLTASSLRAFCLGRGFTAPRFDAALWLALLPAAFAAGPMLTGGDLQPFWLMLGTVVGLLTAVFAGFAAWRLPARGDGEHEAAAFRDIALSVVLPLLALLFPFALNVASGRLAGRIVSRSPLEAGIVFAAVVFGLLVVLWLRADHRLSQRLRGYALLLQVPLVAFYLALMPPLFISPEGPAPEPQAGPLLYLYVGLLMLAALVDLVRRVGYESRAISPLALGGLLICLAVPLHFAPYLQSDDYHFGEYVYPWWALLQHGQIPYVDYVPAHGLVNYLPSAVSTLFFDGTVAAFYSSSTIVNASLTLLMFVLLTPVLGIAAAWIPVFFIPLAAPISWLVVAVAFGLLAWLMGTKRPVAWLVIWFVTGFATVLLAPAQGAALVFATIPAGLLIFWQALRADRKRTVVALGLLGAGLIVLGLLTPVVPITLGALSYVLENGAINAIAYGIPWNATDTPTGFEVLRMGWIAVPLAALVFAFQRPRLFAKPLPLLVLGVAVLFPLLIFGYIMGRIDAGPTRMGVATSWLLLVLLPVLMNLTRARLVAPVLVLATIACSTMFPRAIVPAQLEAVAQAQQPIGELTPLDFPVIGRVVADPAHYARLQTIRDRIDTLLQPDETFLDLTGHVADYAYLERPSPVAVPAPFNLAHPNSQAEAVRNLQRDPPPVALLQAQNLNFDGRSAALRTHLLYRWVAQTYRPIELDGLVYAVLPSRYAGLLENSTVELTTANHSDINWDRGVSRDGNQFFVESAELAGRLAVGDTLDFAGSGVRSVLAVEGRNITVDGSLDAEGDGYPNPIGVSDDLAQVISDDTELVLLDRTFRLADLEALPVSWGRSMDTLKSQMSDVLELPSGSASLNHLSVDGDGWFTATGPDPYLVIGLPALDGSNAGLLVGELACEGAGAARLQVFWESERAESLNEAASVSFSAQDGQFILPLDSQPRWLLSKEIGRIRIDFDDAGGCQRFRLPDLRLAQRDGL